MRRMRTQFEPSAARQIERSSPEGRGKAESILPQEPNCFIVWRGAIAPVPSGFEPWVRAEHSETD